MHAIIPNLQAFGIDGEADRPHFTRFESDALEALQFLDRASHRTHLVMDVELDDLVAFPRARVADVDGHGRRPAGADARLRQARRRQGEAGVAEAEAERVKRIGRVEQIAAPRARLHIVEGRQLPHRSRHGHGQLAARIDVAEQNVCLLYTSPSPRDS